MKNQPTGKSVLLFSGGMDSLMAAHLLRPDVLLYVRHGQRYQAAEIDTLFRLCDRGYVDRARLETADLLDLGKLERPDAIIPLRNLHLLALAARYGETLYIGAMDGDRSLDKSPGFLLAMERMLDLLHQEQHWCAARVFRVEAPFKALTKAQLVRRYLAAGGQADALLVSLSCYEPADGRPCGTCKPCFRKWVALAMNGLATPDYFAADPWTAPWLAAVMSAVRAGQYRGAEDGEWREALDGVGYAPAAGRA